MGLWQKAMISLAFNESLTNLVQSSSIMNRFAGQFVGGKEAEDGLECAKEIKQWGANASLFYLGEYVEDEAKINVTMEQLQKLPPMLASAGLDNHISFDPTQAGAMSSWDWCRDNAFTLAQAIKASGGPGRNALMVDMEDSSRTQQTLDLYWSLRENDLPAAITVQAYLYRSLDDLAKLVRGGAMVRWVKGALAEPASVAYTSPKDRDNEYRKGIVSLFSHESREAGVYPVLGTHDHRMIDFARYVANENGWKNTEWEVEMLLGVRTNYQRELIEQGVSLRCYLPFGKDWFPYSIRRIGETPQNLKFVLRSFFK